MSCWNQQQSNNSHYWVINNN